MFRLENHLSLLWMMMGGVLGVLGRFGLTRWVTAQWGDEFPYGTFLVNVSGCLLVGFLATLAESRAWFGETQRLFYFVGFLGAYTTFSTYLWDSFKMLQTGHFVAAVGNLFGSLCVGLAAVWLGASVAKWLTVGAH